MAGLLAGLLKGTFSLLPIVLLVWAYRFNARRWRSKIDAELRAALDRLGVGPYRLLVDKLTSPSTDRTANVYRILQDDDGNYFLFMKVGEQPALLKPLDKARALLAARMNG